MLTLRTFGKLVLVEGKEPVEGAGSQRRPLAILAVLAAAGPHGLPRERLEALFWPDSGSTRAKGVLKQTLYALRRDAKSSDLIVGTSQLHLNPDAITSDVSQFYEALSAGRIEDALALYDGPFLDGVEFPRLDELERSIAGQRESLAARYRAAAESLAKRYVAAGDNSRVVDLLGQLASHDPYSSQVALRYMEALARAGERERALKHAALHERLLRTQLEVEVPPEIASFVSRLKQGGRTGASAPAPYTPAAHTPAAYTPTASGTEAPEGSAVSPQPRVAQPRRSRRQSVYMSLAGLAAVVIAGMGVRAIAASANKAGLPAGEERRLVILPFENRTGDSSLTALGAMGAEWITDGLSRTGVVPVTDPGSAAAAAAALRRERRGQNFSIGEITKATGARNVVTGNFYRRGDSIEFHARVVDGTNGKVLGAIRPVAVLSSDAKSGISQVRSQVLSLVAQVFDARLSEVTTSDVMPPRFESYREFVAGIDLWALEVESAESDVPSRDPHNTARAHFRRAFALDTTFVTPLVWVLLTLTDGEAGEAASLLDSLIERRDRLTPLDRHAVDYFSAMSRADPAAALRAAKAASDLAPRSEWSWNAGQMLFPMNRPRETMKYFSRLDPDAGWMRLGWEYYWYLTAQTSHMLGDLDGTHAWLSRARNKFPENVPLAAAFARSLALRDEPDSMMTVVREILRSSVDWKAFYVYSVVEDLIRHDRRGDATRVFKELAAWYVSRGNSATEPDRRELARALLSMKMNDAAKRHFARLFDYFPKSTWRTHYTGHLAVLYAQAGDLTTAQKLIESVPREIQQWDGENTYWRARVTAAMGKRADAVDLLRKAFDEGYPQISLSHSTWFEFPNLQGYAPFEALVASDR